MYTQATPALDCSSSERLLAITDNVYTCAVVCVISLTLTGPLYHLPKATLAAIIFVALRSLLDFSRAKLLWRVSRPEFLQWMVSFLGTVIFGVQGGIVGSICLSVLLLLKSVSQPPTAVLGRLGKTSVFVETKRYEDAAEVPGVKIFRFSAPLTFANKDFLEMKLAKMETQDTTEEEVHSVVLDCGSVTTIDTSAAGMLMKLILDYRRDGRRLLLANWRGLDCNGQAVLQHVEFDSLLSKNLWFLSIAEAVDFATAAGPVAGDEEGVPELYPDGRGSSASPDREGEYMSTEKGNTSPGVVSDL